MKKFSYAIIIILLFSCTARQTSTEKKEDIQSAREVFVPGFQSILDSAGVEGSVLVYDPEENSYYSNDFAWARNGHLPASTFKIPNSIIALETGAVDEGSIFIWDGEERIKSWEQDLTFREAFHFSCVPCYQEVARNIGVERMTEYLVKIGYGDMKVDSASIDIFWLEGESRINQMQQIDFLKRFHQSELPISPQTQSIMKRLMVIEETDEYKISGKTGWSVRHGNNNGWFVGYIESQSKVYFFATNVEPEKEFDMSMFPMIRSEVTYKALKEIGVMK